MTSEMMGEISFLMDRFTANQEAPAIAWRDRTYDYGWLGEVVAGRVDELERDGIGLGMPVMLRGDYSPVTIPLLFAFIARKAIIVPMLPATADRHPQLLDIVDPALVIDVDRDDNTIVTRREPSGPNMLYRDLIGRQAPGLVLFTSGSTGAPKGVVHDFSKLLRKFENSRPPMVTLNFLLFDHWGGLNTLLQCLANGGLVVLPERRTPEYICDLMERHRVELLPATPTFLNMLLISRAYEGRNLADLRVISYGAEPMPATTLDGLRAAFPNVELRQTYGLIELGVLRAKSKSSNSLWVKLGGEGYDLRVVDGILQIKAESAMLGYLNAPSPFTQDGYFITGDRVEVSGDYLCILGRDSDLINVGGEKVHPTEVEAVILDCEDVEDAVVYGERSPITGQIVCADVKPRPGVEELEARIRIKRFCNRRLDAFKVPVKIQFVDDVLYGDRLKRIRRRPEATSGS